MAAAGAGGTAPVPRPSGAASGNIDGTFNEFIKEVYRVSIITGPLGHREN